VKWTERWIARAQRKADLRDERFRRHEEGVRAGTEQPRFLERIESWGTERGESWNERIQRSPQRRYVNSDWQLGARSSDASLRLANAWLTWVRNGPIRGPDGVEVDIWIRSAGRDLPYHYTPDDRVWLTRRELTASPSDYTVCLRRMPAGPVKSVRSFDIETSARWYAIELARQVRHVGITALRPAGIVPARSLPAAGVEELWAEGFVAVGRHLGLGIIWLPRRARTSWRRVRTGRR